MLFTSVEFILFFCVVIPVYWIIPQRWRILFLLISSYVFYAFSYPPNALILLATTAIDYFIARGIGQSEISTRRSRLLLLSLLINVGVLFIFKYSAFFYDSVAAIANFSRDPLQSSIALALPLGISFYTFTKIAYVIDVYRRKIAPETNFLTFATFVSFFPNVTSGPIERAGHLIPQIKAAFKPDANQIIEGLRLILWGVFKKIVIADRLAQYVNSVYAYPQEQSGAALLIATLFFAFQIYADFSGYTDIARGIARILGINLFENFNQPYLSKSVLEFWRRWHVSLTTWIREYLFFPMSRYLLKRTERRNPRAVEVTAYLLTMSIIGLWHGANWTYVVWGLIHGIYMGVESLLNARRIRLLPQNSFTNVIKILTTFLLVSFAWIFFRAGTISDAGYIVTHLFSFGGDFLATFKAYTPNPDNYSTQLFISLALILVLIVADLVDTKWGMFNIMNRSPLVVRWAIYYVMTALVIGVLISVSAVQNFVYFQF